MVLQFRNLAARPFCASSATLVVACLPEVRPRTVVCLLQVVHVTSEICSHPFVFDACFRGWSLDSLGRSGAGGKLQVQPIEDPAMGALGWQRN